MPITIASNISALQAGRRLAQSTGALRSVFEHLASGLRINRAADDAAGLAVAESLRVDTRVAQQGIKNLNDGLAVASIAESALGELSGIVIRLRELAEQASNGTLGNNQRVALDKEAQALTKEYFRIASTTEFNGLKLFDGSIQALTIQSGYGVNGGVTSSLGGVMGNGAFGSANVINHILHVARDAATADLNGDGHLDFAFAGDNASSVGTTAISLGNGDGSFKAAASYQTDVTSSRGIAFGDVNGDGIMDLVTAGATVGGSVSTVRIGNGDGTFRHSVTYTHPASTLAGGIALADFNNDGALDMVASGTAGGANGVASVLLNRGDGTFGPAVAYADSASGNNKITVGDLNRDGVMDFVNSGQIDHVFLGNGNGTFKLAAIMPGNATSVDVLLGDYNGDDILDLVTSNSNGSAFVTFRAGRGDGTFQPSTSFALAGSTSNSVASGDFNGDGALDFVAASTSPGPANVFLGNGNGTFKASVSYSSNSPSFTIVAGDFTGDGVFDLVYGGYTAQNNFSFRSGSTQAGIGQLLPFSLRTLADARQSMSVLERAQQALVVQRGQLGALQSRLSTAASTVRVSAENYASAESQLRDADVAQESAQLVRLNILQQAGAAVLAQANVQPRIALDLLRGGR